MKVIFNADDFGITDAVSTSIIELFRAATPLKSATVMINIISDFSVELLKKFMEKDGRSGYSAGLHFNLTCGRPVLPASEVPSLTDGEGFFLKFKDLINKAAGAGVDSADVLREFTAQVKSFYEKTGFYPSHIDSHKHVHMLPQFYKAVTAGIKTSGIKKMRLTQNISARELFLSQGIGAETVSACFSGVSESYHRDEGASDLFYPGAFLGTYSVGALSAPVFEKEISQYAGKNIICEYMTHPGVSDACLKKLSGLLEPREAEFAALKSPELKEILKKYNIEVLSFNDL
jgi:hypothetical protein